MITSVSSKGDQENPSQGVIMPEVYAAKLTRGGTKTKAGKKELKGGLEHPPRKEHSL